jgi:hypothetical protein
MQRLPPPPPLLLLLLLGAPLPLLAWLVAALLELPAPPSPPVAPVPTPPTDSAHAERPHPRNTRIEG